MVRIKRSEAESKHHCHTNQRPYCSGVVFSTLNASSSSSCSSSRRASYHVLRCWFEHDYSGKGGAEVFPAHPERSIRVLRRHQGRLDLLRALLARVSLVLESFALAIPRRPTGRPLRVRLRRTEKEEGKHKTSETEIIADHPPPQKPNAITKKTKQISHFFSLTD